MAPFIYLESDFFRLLQNSKEGVSKSILPILPRAISDMSKFIFSSEMKSIIFKEEVDKDKNSDLKELIRVFEDLHVQGKINLKKVSGADFTEELRKIGTHSPYSICFCSKPNHAVKKLVEQKGYYHVDEENIEEFITNPIFEKDTYEVSQNGDISEWKDLTSLSHNFESVAIFDRYIFSKNQKKGRSSYEETIYELITNLSQKNSAKNIHVLIAAPRSEVDENPAVIRENIQKYIESKNLKKNITIGIVKTIKKSPVDHDRWIFTNFMSIFSGDSLNYFKDGERSIINTTITTNTLLSWSNFKTSLRKLNHFNSIIPERNSIGTEIIKSGCSDLNLFSNNF